MTLANLCSSTRAFNRFQVSVLGDSNENVPKMLRHSVLICNRVKDCYICMKTKSYNHTPQCQKKKRRSTAYRSFNTAIFIVAVYHCILAHPLLPRMISSPNGKVWKCCLDRRMYADGTTTMMPSSSCFVSWSDFVIFITQSELRNAVTIFVPFHICLLVSVKT